MPKLSQYSPRVMGQPGVQFVPSTGPILDAFLQQTQAGGSDGGAGLPGVTTPPPPTSYDYKENAATDYSNWLKTPPTIEQHSAFAAPPPHMLAVPAPDVPDVRQNTLDLARYLPLLSLFGGPRAVGAIAPGAFGGVADYANQDYAKRYQQYGTQVRQAEQTYGNDLDAWKIQLDANRELNRGVDATNKVSQDIYETKAKGLKDILDDRTKGWKQEQQGLTRDLAINFNALRDPDISRDMKASIIGNLNRISERLKAIGGPDTTALDPRSAYDADLFQRAEAEALKVAHGDKRNENFTNAMVQVARIGATSRETIAQWSNALRKLELEQQKTQRESDDTARMFAIRSANLRSAAEIEADLLKFRTDQEYKTHTHMDEMSKVAYGALAGSLARKIEQRDKLLKTLSDYSKLGNDRNFEPDPVTINNMERFRIEAAQLSNDIKRDTEGLNRFFPSMRGSVQEPSIPGETPGTRALKGSGAERQPAPTQRAPGGDGGGRAVGATPPARSGGPKRSPSEVKVPEVNPNRNRQNLPPGAKAVRPGKMTPEEKSRLDAAP